MVYTSSYKKIKVLMSHTMENTHVIIVGALGDSIDNICLFCFQLLVFELEKCEVPDVSFVTEPKIIGEPVTRH